MKNYFNENFKDNIENSVSRVGKMRIFHFSFSTKTVVLLMVGLIMILGSLSVYAVLNDDENILSTTVSDTSTQAITYTAQTEEIDEEVLILLIDDNQENINLILVVTLDSSSSSLMFEFVESDQEVSLGNETMSLQSYYSTYGMTQFISAIEISIGDEIERYVTMTQANACTIIETIGAQKVEVIDDITYNYNGINYLFLEGSQTLTSDMLTKYLLYLSDAGEDVQSEIMDIIVIYTKAFLQLYSIEDGYEVMVKIVSTNISAYDIMEQKTALEAFFYNEDGDEVIIEANLK